MNALYPIVPELITVHLGVPDNDEADNVTVTFQDYIKNVASSEIYPTWPEAALRANIYAQISFALNRIYTEFYPSRGKDFDITSSPAYDQTFVYGRDIYDNISEIVDEIFNDYIVRGSNIEPLYAVYCNGTTVTCNGLSQWGSVGLAENGLSAYDILASYYGNEINIVENAPVGQLEPSPPNLLLAEGSAGNDVKFIQIRLNRISTNYPSIPKIQYPDGIYGAETANAVKAFQRIFGLSQTGEVNRATWYKIQTVYNAVKQLSELESEGLRLEEVSNQFPAASVPGDSGTNVSAIQYYLHTISLFNPSIPSVEIDGYFGPSTEESVKAFQREYGLAQSGEVDADTWNTMFDAYYGIINTLSDEQLGYGHAPFPGVFLKIGAEGESVLTLQQYINAASTVYPAIPKVDEDGIFGSETRNAVYAAQAVFEFPINGIVGPLTWNALAETYDDVMSNTRSEYQYPGEIIGTEEANS